MLKVQRDVEQPAHGEANEERGKPGSYGDMLAKLEAVETIPGKGTATWVVLCC